MLAASNAPHRAPQISPLGSPVADSHQFPCKDSVRFFCSARRVKLTAIKAKGTHVFTTASAQNLDFVLELGADRAIDYRSEPFEEVTRDVDVILDLVGGETQERSWSVLKPGGILVSALGEPSREKAAQKGMRGVGFRAQPKAAQLVEIARLIDRVKVSPVLSATYPLAEARRAQEQLERSHVRGKIVLEVSE